MKAFGATDYTKVLRTDEQGDGVEPLLDALSLFKATQVKTENLPFRTMDPLKRKSSVIIEP